MHSYNGKSVKIELTREQFEEMTRHLVEKCSGDLRNRDAGSEDGLVEGEQGSPVGGMTRMPMIRKMITDLSSVPLVGDVNPDEAVAVGAAIQAVLSLWKKKNKTGEHSLPEETRQQFSSREGSLSPGAQHHLPHVGGRALG